MNIFKKAFTLAEVLITLTIIGVIAALTIPNLMQNYRKQERISQIKTAYTILGNAAKLAIAEHGSPDGWYINRDEMTDSISKSFYLAKNYFVPYLKTQKICGARGYSQYFEAGTGCFGNGGQSGNGEWYYLNNTNSSNAGSQYGSAWWYTIQLENGMGVGIQYHGTWGAYIIVDVNGPKGPNLAGNDVFGFYFDFQQGAVRTGMYVYNNYYIAHPHGGFSSSVNNATVEELLNNTGAFACNKNASGGGLGCTLVLEKNGWKVPDNYPIKKW